jgi:hypothetical protein
LTDSRPEVPRRFAPKHPRAASTKVDLDGWMAAVRSTLWVVAGIATALLGAGLATLLGAPVTAREADPLGVREEVSGVLDRPSVHVAAAILEGDFERGADISARDGFVVDEAMLRAAEALVEAGRRAEADVQLQKALTFYRSVRAARFIREGEALLAATA